MSILTTWVLTASLTFWAASFAYYITECDLLDPLCCAEAWDYLRDVLRLILRHHYREEDEPLALLVCPIIAQALNRLLQDASPRAGSYFFLLRDMNLMFCDHSSLYVILTLDIVVLCRFEGVSRR